MANRDEIIALLEHAEIITSEIHVQVCATCEDVCHTVYVRCAFKDERWHTQTIMYRPHVDQLHEALSVVAMMFGSYRARIAQREAERWIVEHQMVLDL